MRGVPAPLPAPGLTASQGAWSLTLQSRVPDPPLLTASEAGVGSLPPTTPEMARLGRGGTRGGGSATECRGTQIPCTRRGEHWNDRTLVVGWGEWGDGSGGRR